MAQKRYYWLKLDKDFFKQKEIKKLRKIAGGDTYTIIYLKMQLLSLENGGYLYHEGIEDNFSDEIALILDEDAENVKITVMFLKKYNLLLEVGNEYSMLATIGAVGSESESAERVRKYRKALQCNATVTACNKNVTAETEKDIEIEKELKQQLTERNHSISRRKNTLNKEICQGGLSTDLNELSTNLSIEQRKYLLDNFNKKDIEEKYVVFLQQKNIRNAYSWFLAALKKDFKPKNISKTVNFNCDKCHGTGSYACQVGESGEIISVVCDCSRNG
ncbi:phage replisome organizer N-terminal domain-containing protein [Anaerosinus sp.]|uniref:phage replisome organizer N-terminal domain-containing protein n=1 Tax=Selenobaculum sp. TaxID=3074374 RepID=UPI003AB77598